MGGFTKIQLKDCDQENIDKQNEKLDKIGLKKDIRFYSEKDIRDEYAFYRSTSNKDEYYPPHLFPKPINNYNEFKKIWTGMGEVFVPPIGALTFDCYFDRTSQRAMKMIGKYLLNNIDQIEKVEGSFTTFVERTGLPTKKKLILYQLETPKQEPEKLPKKEQYIPDIQTGHFLCKSIGIEPFWVTFGNVEEPTFMKKKIYKDDLYNEIYRNKEGYAFMLMPLMPLDVETDWHEKVINRALDLGLREHPIFILSYLYGVESNNEEKYIKEVKECYSKDEIVKKFNIVHNQLKETYGYGTINGFELNITKNKFEPCLGDRGSRKMQAHCQILNVFLKASGCDYNHQKQELTLN
jgi:hypothetical protein